MVTRVRPASHGCLRHFVRCPSAGVGRLLLALTIFQVATVFPGRREAGLEQPAVSPG